MIYLDHAATTPMRPGVLDAMEPFARDAFGNSSGSHGISREAKNALEDARESAAEMLGCRPLEIVFTSGGTESDNLAVKGAALAGGRRGGVVTTAIEHEAVLEAAGFLERLGCPVTVVPVDPEGVVDPLDIGRVVDGDTAVVSVMLANNETGAVQPVREVVEAVDGRAAVHTDAVQVFVSEDVDVDSLGVDLLSLAAHKFGGPKGVGLLYVREGTALEPVLHGGGQELGRRSGTHNVMGAVGMVTAMRLAVDDRVRLRSDVERARKAFESALGEQAQRTVPVERSLVQHSHLRISGIRNETMLVLLDRKGLAASAASACQSGAVTVSHVLDAMGMTPDEARECLRFSFGWSSTVDEAERAAEVLIAAIEAAS